MDHAWSSGGGASSDLAPSAKKSRRASARWARRSFRRPIRCLAVMTSAAYGFSMIMGPCMAVLYIPSSLLIGWLSGEFCAALLCSAAMTPSLAAHMPLPAASWQGLTACLGGKLLSYCELFVGRGSCPRQCSPWLFTRRTSARQEALHCRDHHVGKHAACICWVPTVLFQYKHHRFDFSYGKVMNVEAAPL